MAKIGGRTTNIAQGPDGNLYVSDGGLPIITRLNALGEQKAFASHPDLLGTLGFIFDEDEQIFVASNIITEKVLKIDLQGNI